MMVQLYIKGSPEVDVSPERYEDNKPEGKERIEELVDDYQIKITSVCNQIFIYIIWILICYLNFIKKIIDITKIEKEWRGNLGV